MRSILPLFAVLLFGCSTTSLYGDYVGYVNHEAEGLEVASFTEWFSNNSLEKVNTEGLVDQKGDYYLSTVIESYPNQTNGLEKTDSMNEGVSFRVNKLEVRNSFTLNIPDPGPVYKLTMGVDIYENGEFLETKELKVRVNMASVVNEERIFNWLTPEEKNDLQNQLLTFEVGLTRLYQKLYFSHFDINLHRI